MKLFSTLMAFAPIVIVIALVFLWVVDSDVNRNAMFFFATMGWFCVALDEARARLAKKIEAAKKGE